MKKIVVVLSLFIAPIIISGQSIFEKYEDQEHVTSVVVNQKMFKMLANIDVQTNDPDSDAFINQVKMLDNLTVYTTDNIGVSNSMKKDVEKYIKNSFVNITSTSTCEGFTEGGEFCGTETPYKVYFAAEFDRPANESGTWRGN